MKISDTNNNIRKSGKLDFLFRRRKRSKYYIIIPIIMYLLLYVCTVIAARSGAVMTIWGKELPLSAFAGVFSSLSSICLVVMVLFYKKFGFITSMVIILGQSPILVVQMIAQKNLTSIPGLFSMLFTVLMMVIIYLNQSKLEREQKRMQDLFEQTATALVNAIDAKDKYTHGHSARVAEYSRRLAEMSHKSEEECDEVYHTALLHDVGKIGIPISIINKKGRLTAEEYETVKQHPVLGAQILDKITEYPYLAIGAHYHHERYDGKGYPDGLKGEDIPEIARIVSVADAYDAMTSIRSYRDPLSQDKVREEIVKGAGTQFDPYYARLMLHLIDVDTEYEMKERAEANESDINGVLNVAEHRSAVSAGILITDCMTTVSLKVGSEGGKAPVPSMILFDAHDGKVHTDERTIAEYMYFEYGEVWFDGKTETAGARKMQTRLTNSGSDSKHKGEYRLEAVRISDHALIRIISKSQTAEVTVALPDSSRFLYIGLTGENCSISDLHSVQAQTASPADYIPRIAEKISYIDVPAGDMPNVQIDGYRTASSEGVEIKDGLKLTFHTRCLPTARLIWHCPFIALYCSDDGRIGGKGYRELAFVRFDGEFWENDKGCFAKLDVEKTDAFGSWDNWMQLNRDGYDTEVTFKAGSSKITVITENGGISINDTLEMNGINQKIYAAVTGDQVAVTNIRHSCR